jgi:hypothetical protein
LKLRLSSDFAIDTDDYKREGLRISILAMSGHGKSNAAADIVEDVLDNGAQVIIIEPIPEWHTLKARYNNVVVVGGPYQDLPLEPAFAHEYVKSALEKGISLVVNVSDIEDDVDQVRFVSSFLWNLYRLEQKYRRVVFLVLEEADTWAPQNWDQTTKPSLSRVSLIAKHGRKIGIFPILISQRPADLHKSPLSQCNVNLFGRFTSPADLSEKTGIMYVVKKQHLPISEEQIMKLPQSTFIVTDQNGVHTVAVRKRLCPHGADTPLVETKPFTADVSNALSSLSEEITKAVAAKKAEDSEVKRLGKEVERLRAERKELEAKANIKLSIQEMISGNGKVAPEVLEKQLEEARQQGFKEATEKLDAVKKEWKVDEYQNTIASLKDENAGLKRENAAFGKLKEALAELLPTPLPTGLPTESNAVGLQATMTIVDVAAAEKLVTISTESFAGKILWVAKKGKLDKWQQLGEVVKAVEEEKWTATSQQVNNALNDLVKDGLIAKKHTDRNYFCLANNVRFVKEVVQ